MTTDKDPFEAWHSDKYNWCDMDDALCVTRYEAWQASREQALSELEPVAIVAKSPMNVSVVWIKEVPHNTRLFALKELLT